jgi:hypothetical protein
MTRDDLLTFDGVTQPIIEWALDYGIPSRLIIRRLGAGWAVQRAVETPMRTRPGARLVEVSPKSKAAPKPKAPSKPKAEPRRYEFAGQSLTLKEWSQKLDITEATLRHRIKAKLAPELIFSSQRPPSHRSTSITAFGESHSHAEWARIAGIPNSTLFNRLKAGLSIEDALSKPNRNKKHRGVSRDFKGIEGTGAHPASRDSAYLEISE